MRTRAGSWAAGVEGRVARFLQDLRLLHPGDRPLLMLSGGADSMALLELLRRADARLRLGLAFAALHVDYGLRGADSARDRRFVEEACAAAGVPLRVVEARGLGGPGLQQRAREARYAAARRWCEEDGRKPLVTAHNRDDQAETVLYRLLKYPSPAALQGMPVSADGVVRPLLCLSSGEVRRYCASRGITYGDDVSNERVDYARNALRLEVLPAMAAITPRAAEALADVAAMAHEQQELFSSLAEQAWERVSAPARRSDEHLLPALSVAALLREAPALRTACVRRFLSAALGPGRLVGRRSVASLARLASKPGEGRVALPDGWEAAREGDLLVVRRRDGLHDCSAASTAVSLEEPVRLGFCGRSFVLHVARGARFRKETAAAWIGLAAVPAAVTLRHPRGGDRFSPLGLEGHQTALRFLTNRGLSPAERRRSLLIEVDGEIAWVEGRVARRFRVSESTLLTLHVREEER